MSAATASRDTSKRPAQILKFPVAAATVIFLGTMAALNAAGNLVPASDAAALRVVGMATETIDNTDGDAGDLSCKVERGCFKFDNSADNALDADDKGELCYVEDDQTVAETSTHKIHAGRVVDVESDGVWVEVGYVESSAAVATTVGAALVAIAGGESPTEAEHNLVIALLNQARVDILALAAKVNGG